MLLVSRLLASLHLWTWYKWTSVDNSAYLCQEGRNECGLDHSWLGRVLSEVRSELGRWSCAPHWPQQKGSAKPHSVGGTPTEGIWKDQEPSLQGSCTMDAQLCQTIYHAIRCIRCRNRSSVVAGVRGRSFSCNICQQETSAQGKELLDDRTWMSRCHICC